MKFAEFKNILRENFREASETHSHLFNVNVDKDEMWNLYLDSFPQGSNEIFRKRRVHDCSCCHHFIRSIGDVVFINEDNKLQSIWRLNIGDDIYQVVCDAMAEYIESKVVNNVYLSDSSRIGTDRNRERLESGEILTWDHFYLELDSKYIGSDIFKISEIRGEERTKRQTLESSLNIISIDALNDVLELIEDNNLYRGEEYRSSIERFKEIKEEYEKVEDSLKNNYLWRISAETRSDICKIKNIAIGVLLEDISNGVLLDEAVKKFEVKIVGSANYKRPKPIFTKKMLEEARKTATEKGYINSLARRYANESDISINDVLYKNANAGISRIQDPFTSLEGKVTEDKKKFKDLKEVPYEEFIKNILPEASDIKVLFENRLSGNLMSLTTQVNKESKNMFKWNNGFGWVYSGNIADSMIKRNVELNHGNVEGFLRFSIMWNYGKTWNRDDLDAHCIEPNSYEIFFPNEYMKSPYTKGELDIDNQQPDKGVPGVENIFYQDRENLLDGDYLFYVNQYKYRGSKDGFKAEIEIDGELYEYEYNYPLRQGENIKVALVHYDKATDTLIMKKEFLESKNTTKNYWGITTNQFIPVKFIMYSPNYWKESNGTGNKHLFFILPNCINKELPNAFFNEFLKEELRKDRKVYEALGSQLKIEDSDNQLSGLGFSTTKKDNLIIRYNTTNKQETIKLIF